MEGLELSNDYSVDNEAIVEIGQVSAKAKKAKINMRSNEDGLVNCLINKRVHVNYMPVLRGNITNPKHEYYGGMANSAFRRYSLPTNQFNGAYVLVLTEGELRYLEHIMGLEYNALSIHLKKDNYWDDINVRLTKGTNILNLSDPSDFIKYKILLVNKDEIAASIQESQNNPKASYRFVIVEEGELERNETKAINKTMQAYKLYGKFEDDFDTLKTIIELIEGKQVSSKSKIDYLQSQINRLITQDASRFVQTASDPLLQAKVIIKKAIASGIIKNRGSHLFLAEGNVPLCGNGQDPTLSVAAQYISLPKLQELRFSIEAKLER